MSCVKNEKIRHNPDIIAATIIEMICNDLKFYDMQNDTEYVLLQSVLKEQKRLQAQQEKRLVKVSKKDGLLGKLQKPQDNKKSSKFKEKYRDRVESIQNTDAKTAENRRIAEEIEKMERAKRVSGEHNTERNRRQQPRRAQRRSE